MKNIVNAERNNYETFVYNTVIYNLLPLINSGTEPHFNDSRTNDLLRT